MKIPNYCHRSQKKRLTEKQVAFKKLIGLTETGIANNGKYEHVLSEKDALQGANFYCYKNAEEWERLKIWSNKNSKNRVTFDSQGLRIMSRSEHIPYNMFYPLAAIQEQNAKDEKLILFFELLCNSMFTVHEVQQIRIEFVSDTIKKDKLLNDNTSFDVYVELKTSVGIVALGIEVKYTEGSYPYGKKEKEAMKDEKLPYCMYSKGIYKPGATLELNTKELKQPWRNHLLGIALCSKDASIDRFYSVHIYPESNKYQAEVVNMYTKLLLDTYSFIPVTFELFTTLAFKAFGVQNWIEYIQKRY